MSLLPTAICIDDHHQLEVIHQFTYSGPTISDNLSPRRLDQQAHHQGCDDLKTPHHPDMGEPQADNDNQNGNVQCVHSQTFYSMEVKHGRPSRLLTGAQI